MRPVPMLLEPDVPLPLTPLPLDKPLVPPALDELPLVPALPLDVRPVPAGVAEPTSAWSRRSRIEDAIESDISDLEDSARSRRCDARRKKIFQGRNVPVR